MKDSKKSKGKKSQPKFALVLLCLVAAVFIISLVTAGNVHIVFVQFSNHEEGQSDDIFNYFPIQVHTNEDNLHSSSSLSSSSSLLSTSEELIPSLFKNTNGENWNVISFPSFDSALDHLTDEEKNVRWANFTSTTNRTRSMAIHAHFDYISRAINRKHHWDDCDVLPQLWNEGKESEDNRPKVYVEIGANIGSCVMEMLLSTNALIVAFEPHPKNQLCLLQTIAKLEPELQKRVIIVPIALGDAQGSSTIYSANNNMGNSVIGQIVKDYDAQTFDEDKKQTIQIERLDFVFNDIVKDRIDIQLLKLDAQGYECRILAGMSDAIGSSIQQVKFEYAQKWIKAQNCTDFFPRLRQFGFNIYRGENLVTDDESVKAALVDLIAKKSE